MTNIPGKQLTGEQPGNQPPAEKTYTQSQVNEMMRKRVERSHNSFFKRYGVNSVEELDDLVGKSNSYQPTKDLYDELTKSHDELTTRHKDLSKRYAYKVGNINPEKYSDIETYFKGKGIDIDEESLMKELQSHPDWTAKVSTIQTLGAEASEPPSVDEAALASQIFGVDLTK